MSDAYHIDKAAVAASFGRAAAGYDAHADLQRRVADRLAQGLVPDPDVTRILDLGAGTGYGHGLLRTVYPDAEIVSLDIAEAMLRHARASGASPGPLVCADAERLPFAPDSFDLVFSSLTIQWCRDYPALFRGLRDITRPGGRCLLSTFGPDTLVELKRAWAAVDAHVHVNRFLDEEGVLAAIDGQGFGRRRLETQVLVRHYPSLNELGRELKAIGAHNMNSGQARGLTGKQRLRRLREAFQRGEEAGRGVPVTWQIYYLDLRA